MLFYVWEFRGIYFRKLPLVSSFYNRKIFKKNTLLSNLWKGDFVYMDRKANELMAKTINIAFEQRHVIERAKQNDRLAQKQLYDAYAPTLLSICRLYIKDEHFAEDILVKAFFKILTHLHAYEEKQHFFAWMRKIIVNECVDFQRSKIQKVTYSEWDDSLDSLDELSSNHQFEEEYIQSFIDELPVGCRLVFSLYVFEDYDHKDISNELGISVGTSKSQLAYAKKLLKEKLNKKTIHNGKSSEKKYKRNF
ncbi:Sigma-W factor (modular protein) [Capnocytophaga canis]|uniref:Sigma-W factor (Modular protein) n=2 Tax=Capnocytophaga canis TaxID=1848903 RepID=A0A0B7HZ56_9FLAO|nr:Sigma-W factor (modular protein) [Capnocytophaga canis]